MWLLHDNASAHRCAVAQDAIRECRFLLLDHSSYSPDLAASDNFLFGHLKNHLRGTRFKDDEELKSAVDEYFSMCDTNFFLNGIVHLKSRCESCVHVGGCYV